MKTKTKKNVDRIQALKCLIHPETEDVDTEILECLLNPGYDSFAGVCEYMDKNNVKPEDIRCVVEDRKPSFVNKSTGEVIELTKEVEEGE